MTNRTLHDDRAPARLRRVGRAFPRRLLAGAVALLASAAPLRAQYRVVAPSGDTIRLTAEQVRAMLDTTRALRRNLEEDPRVLYDPRFGERVNATTPDAAWPWNAVDVVNDSMAVIHTPGNLREAARAYENYAVMRMQVVRGRDPDAPCDSLVAWEAEAVSAFVDGWVVARTLFGGPAFAPLDEVAFTRRDGHLPALIAEKRDRQVGACAGEWAEDHAAELEAFRHWREASEDADGEKPGAAGPPPDAPPAPGEPGGTGR